MSASGPTSKVLGVPGPNVTDTICEESRPVILEALEFPAPVISQAIEPKTRQDQEKLSIGLQRLAIMRNAFALRCHPPQPRA